MMKKVVKTIIFSTIALIAIIVIASSLYVVEENQFACTFRFSQMINTQETAGLYFKIPFVDEVKYFPKSTQLYDVLPSEVLTADNQNMTVDCYVLWHITDPQTFNQRFRGSMTVAEASLESLTYNELKTALGKMKQSDIINMNDGTERNEIYESITAAVHEKAAKDYGIAVEDVKIKRFDLPQSNLQAVYNRMISERNQMAEKYTANGNFEASKIRNDVDKQVNILVSNAQAEAATLEAEGEAEYMKMLAEAYNSPEKQEFYEFILALDALKASLTGSNKTVILDRDSDLAQILMGAGN